MAVIIDPDKLNQGVEVVINSTNKTIQLLVAGNLTNDGVTGQCLYSFLKEEWKNDDTLFKFPFPMTSIRPWPTPAGSESRCPKPTAAPAWASAMPP